MMVMVFWGPLGNLLLKVKLQNMNNFHVKHVFSMFQAVFSISLLVSKGKVKPFCYDFWGDYSVLLQYLSVEDSFQDIHLPFIPHCTLAAPYQNLHMLTSLHVQWCWRAGAPYMVTDPAEKTGGQYFGQGT